MIRKETQNISATVWNLIIPSAYAFVNIFLFTKKERKEPMTICESPHCCSSPFQYSSPSKNMFKNYSLSSNHISRHRHRTGDIYIACHNILRRNNGYNAVLFLRFVSLAAALVRVSFRMGHALRGLQSGQHQHQPPQHQQHQQQQQQLWWFHRHIGYTATARRIRRVVFSVSGIHRLPLFFVPGGVVVPIPVALVVDVPLLLFLLQLLPLLRLWVWFGSVWFGYGFFIGLFGGLLGCSGNPGAAAGAMVLELGARFKFMAVQCSLYWHLTLIE